MGSESCGSRDRDPTGGEGGAKDSILAAGLVSICVLSFPISSQKGQSTVQP